jgi:UDP-N-acetyl-D-galactosamine dehydrogenase
VSTLPNPSLPTCTAVVGMTHAGLALAAALAQRVRTVAFDADRVRIGELRKGVDQNGDIPPAALHLGLLRFSSDPHDLTEADAVVISAPVSVDPATGAPEHGPLEAGCRQVGEALARRRTDAPPALVVIGAATYPGCVEQVCRPVLEAASGLEAGVGFALACAPERVGPGDGLTGLASSVQVVAGADPNALERVAALYGIADVAGVHRAADLRAAEAASVVEAAARDAARAFANETALALQRMGLDAHAVLDAAATGAPPPSVAVAAGLGGGHAAQAPRLLAHAARAAGHEPQLWETGIAVNESMPRYVAEQVVRLLTAAARPVERSLVLLLGLTAQEDARDIERSGAVALAHALMEAGAKVLAHDPYLAPAEIEALGIRPHTSFARGFDAAVLAVPHRSFRESAANWLQTVSPGGVVVDVRGTVDPGAAAARHLAYWRL